jgi:hypothetical protein
MVANGCPSMWHLTPCRVQRNSYPAREKLAISNISGHVGFDPNLLKHPEESVEDDGELGLINHAS